MEAPAPASLQDLAPALAIVLAIIAAFLLHRPSGSRSAPSVGPSPEVDKARRDTEQAHQQAEQDRQQKMDGIEREQNREVSQIIEREQARADEVLRAIDEEDKTPVGTSPDNQGALDKQTDWLLEQGKAAQGTPPRGSP